MNKRMEMFVEDLPADKQAIYKFVTASVTNCSFRDFLNNGGVETLDVLLYYSECRDWIASDPESFREILEDEIAAGERIVDVLPEWDEWHGWSDDSNACMAAWAVFHHVAEILADMEE